MLFHQGFGLLFDCGRLHRFVAFDPHRGLDSLGDFLIQAGADLHRSLPKVTRLVRIVHEAIGERRGGYCCYGLYQTKPCSVSGNSCAQPLDHRLDSVGSLLEFCINLGQFARRLEYLEVAVEWILIADFGLVVVDPRIRRVGQHFAFEVAFHVFVERDILGIAQ